MEPKTRSKKVRLQFDFSEESLAKFDALAKRMGAHTRAEAFRKVLIFYNEVDEAEQRGAKFMLQEQDGTFTRIIRT